MKYELKARMAHKSGSNCASAVYNTFRDVNPDAGSAPFPRSEGGKCGALLAAEKTLREMGLEADFDEMFLAEFGALKCADLRRRHVPCNDLVGGAARLLETLISSRMDD